MYGIFTYIWAILGVNVGKYATHGASGYCNNLDPCLDKSGVDSDEFLSRWHDSQNPVNHDIMSSIRHKVGIHLHFLARDRHD